MVQNNQPQKSADHKHIDNTERFTRLDRRCEICGIKICFNCHQSIEENKGVHLFPPGTFTQTYEEIMEIIEESENNPNSGIEVIRGKNSQPSHSDDDLDHWFDICKS